MTTRMTRLRKAAAAGSVLAVAGAITLAAYSDWAEMETEFTTGTFGIAIDGDEGNPVPYSVAFDASDLNPGDTAETLVDLQNTGTIDADVALVATTTDASSTEDEAFLDALLGSYSTDGGASWSSEVPLTDLTTDSDIFLQGGESTPFSVRVHFEEGTGNAAQGGRVGVNFRFEAEQSTEDAGDAVESPAVSVDQTEYVVGETMEVTISGLLPNTEYYADIDSDTEYGSTFNPTADSEGVAYFEYEVRDVHVGDGELVVNLQNSDTGLNVHLPTGATVID